MTQIKADIKWRRPRESIASKYMNNDFGYATHGSLAGAQIFKVFDLKPSEAKELTVLDYGCGTGREARILSVFFKEVYAWDPTAECLHMFRQENDHTQRDFMNLHVTFQLENVPRVDLGYSFHVIEHLNDEQANLMIDNLKAKVKTFVALNYDGKKNSRVMKPYLTPEEIAEDAERVATRRYNITRMMDFHKQK